MDPRADSKEEDDCDKDSNPQEYYLHERSKEIMTFAEYQHPNEIEEKLDKEHNKGSRLFSEASITPDNKCSDGH